MIELRGLTKSYVTEHGRRRFVFRDLTFRFPDGVNIGLIGGNGAGKSTLMRLLGGIDTPDSGAVITNKSISWPIGLQGGFNGTLSGRDNVKFVCRIYGSGRAEMQGQIRQVQEFAEIGDYFDLPVRSYSSGMRSRLAFGLSMAFHFDYYLIDEVMAVGDAQFKRKSKAALEERLKGSNIILVSHNMAEVSKLCDVVVLLQGGEATLYEDIREGIRAYQGDESPAGAAQPRAGARRGPGRALGPQAARRPGGAGVQGAGAVRRPGGPGPRRPQQAGGQPGRAGAAREKALARPGRGGRPLGPEPAGRQGAAPSTESAPGDPQA